MPGDDINDDDYVANLLKQDAKNSAKKYGLVGLDAFNPQRSQLRAPKPNTRFLRHIIRETDSHNAALLAKEAEESRTRLRELEREKLRTEERDRRREQGRLTPPDLDEDSGRHTKKRRRGRDNDDARDRARRRRTEYSKDEEKDSAPRSRREDYRGSREHRSRTDMEKEKEKRKGERRHDHVESEGRSHKSSHSTRDRVRHDASDLEEDDHHSRRKHDSHRKHRKRKLYSYSRSRSHLRSPETRKDHKPSRQSHEHRSNRHRSHSPGAKGDKRSAAIDRISSGRRRSLGPQSDSDPLEAIVGPLPPPPQPTICSRGRGAYKAKSTAMDARFSSAYDPAIDVHLNSDAEDQDDWGDALEAFRDRQKWKQQGAERLREAGFTDEQVKKWEKGDEKNEEDVVWAKKGEAREWDRNKVVDDDGDVALEADWGRLK